MEQGQLKNFRVWFYDYVAGFYSNDEYVNANLKLKEEHSRRVCEEMSYLAGELELSDNQKWTADAIALLHDVGRFEQFVKYQTYNDARSVNHCLLGVEVLRREKVLEQVEKASRKWIEKAIENHGRIDLPKDLGGEELLFSKLIRDADKIDVFYVATEYYKQYRDNPNAFTLELEFPDEPTYSKKIVERILCGRLIDYSKLRTINDMKLCQLGWVYDVNFTATLKRIKDRRFLEKILDFLPKTEDINRVREKIFGYVDSRIEQDDKR
jgi:hypothetical protein